MQDNSSFSLEFAKNRIPDFVDGAKGRVLIRGYFKNSDEARFNVPVLSPRHKGHLEFFTFFETPEGSDNFLVHLIYDAFGPLNLAFVAEKTYQTRTTGLQVKSVREATIPGYLEETFRRWSQYNCGPHWLWGEKEIDVLLTSADDTTSTRLDLSNTFLLNHLSIVLGSLALGGRWNEWWKDVERRALIGRIQGAINSHGEKQYRKHMLLSGFQA